MASLIDDPNGFRRIQFFNRTRKRKTIRLGQMDRREAERAHRYIEKLIAADKQRSTPADEVNEWVAGLSDDLHSRLVRVGLVPLRAPTELERQETEQEAGEKARAGTLGPFLDRYIASRIDAKPNTITNFTQVRRCLVSCFGEDKPLSTFTLADGERFRLWMVGQGNNKNTVRRRCGHARQFFEVALDDELITKNPFAKLETSVRPNKERAFFVTRAVIGEVLDACPDDQWKLLVALVRYGGLRHPSETLSLKWEHINWERSLMIVPSPKTERYEDGAERPVPIFPELMPYLTKVFSGPGQDQYVISRWRSRRGNISEYFRNIIIRAGVKPWPRIWQNLRASRATELVETFPTHVVNTWLGHTETIADRFYRQTTDDHLQRAICTTTSLADEPGSHKAAQKAAQQVAEGSGTERKEKTAIVDTSPKTHLQLVEAGTPHSAVE